MTPATCEAIQTSRTRRCGIAVTVARCMSEISWIESGTTYGVR